MSRFIVSVFATMVLSGALIAPRLGAAVPSGHEIRVDSLEGRVDLVVPGAASRPLAVGELVAMGSRVETSRDAWVALRWEDETLLRLRGGSLVELSADGFRLYRGDSWIRVAKVGRSFEALTYNAVASVRGTCFTVSTRSSSAALRGLFRERSLRGPALFSGARAARVSGTQILDWISAFFSLKGEDVVMTTCKVFEGRVLFSPRSSDGETRAGLLLRPSLVACVLGDEASRPMDMAGTDFRDQGPGFIRYPTGHDELDARLLPTIRTHRLLRRRRGRSLPARADERPLSKGFDGLRRGTADGPVVDDSALDEKSLERILEAGFEGRRQRKK